VKKPGRHSFDLFERLVVVWIFTTYQGIWQNEPKLHLYISPCNPAQPNLEH